MKNTNARVVIREWRKDHPYGHRSDLYKSGLVSRSSVDRYWDECSTGTEPLSAKETVRRWRSINPHGTPADCIKMNDIAKSTVYLYWKETEPEYEPTLAKAKKQDAKSEPAVMIGMEEDGQMFFDFSSDGSDNKS